MFLSLHYVISMLWIHSLDDTKEKGGRKRNFSRNNFFRLAGNSLGENLLQNVHDHKAQCTTTITENKKIFSPSWLYTSITSRSAFLLLKNLNFLGGFDNFCTNFTWKLSTCGLLTFINYFIRFFSRFSNIFCKFSQRKKSRFPVFMSQKLAEINLEGGWNFVGSLWTCAMEADFWYSGRMLETLKKFRFSTIVSATTA